jgi:hypothetical protein
VRSVSVTVRCDDVAFGGCGHGYWKNHQGQWPSAYVPATTLGSVFAVGGTNASLSTNSLADALAFGAARPGRESAAPADAGCGRLA